MKLIGRIDKADFPELKIQNIKIKIDTGAYTSSINSHDVKETKINNECYLEFKILSPSNNSKAKTFRTKKYKIKTIKNSFGDTEQRFIIETTIIIFGEEYTIDLSLSKRYKMKYPVLLGRKFLNKGFLVDTSQKNISFKLKQKKL
jgi:hypothetical protein